MTKIFSSYTSTVRKMIKMYNVELYNYFTEQNIEEVWVNHDNWNGGVDFYNIVIRIPVEFFEELRKNGTIERIENMINEYYTNAMRGMDDSVQISSIVLKPYADEMMFIGDNIDDSMWKLGQFRLFISHLTINKESASNLKNCLSNYGIDCFVAHEDITPSKEWENEIEKALYTMDALCAIVVPNFVGSQWCDQEVGFALGQKKLVIPIDKGNLPYGFLGKYQALKSKNKNVGEVANDIKNIISTNEKTKQIYLKKLVNLIINANNKLDALKYIEIIKKCENVNKYYIENLHDNFKTNEILNTSDVIESINSLFNIYGLESIICISPSSIKENNSYLPF